MTKDELLVFEAGDAGEDFAFEEFEGGAAAGGDEGHLVAELGFLDGLHAVAAADDVFGAGIGRHGLGDVEGAFGGLFDLEHAHRAVPDDGLRLGNFFA